MKHKRYIQAGWILLLTGLLIGLIVTPAGAASNVGAQFIAPSHAGQRQSSTTSVNATIYITNATLAPIFQSNLNAQVPGVVSSAISGIVGKLPKQDQGWALQMATTLLQPSASLTSLTTQANGLAASIRLSLYPGDPQPVTATMLVSLSVIDSSTIQVSATPMSGSPALVNGPLTTFTIPIGQLSSISTTPTCGDSSLAVKLQFPINLGQGQTSSQVQPAVLSGFFNGQQSQSSKQMQTTSYRTSAVVPNGSTNSYVELPASSLASMGNTIGSLPVSGSMTAKNIQVGVQGSNMVINSDIYDSFWGKIGTATTTVAPTTSGGNLNVNVLSTNITVLNIFTFPYNTYNQQIQQTLNAKLNGALTGKFYVTQAAIGANSHVPCAASNSLVLTGSANLG
jgi:hypothetical protein